MIGTVRELYGTYYILSIPFGLVHTYLYTLSNAEFLVYVRARTDLKIL
jgi:hypothetical protein